MTLNHGIAGLNVSWEEKLRNAEQALELRQQALEDLGISLTGGGIAVDMTKSYLINLNADPAMNEMLVYYLKDTATTIGTKNAATHQDIVLSGLGIADKHAVIDVNGIDLYARPIGSAQVFVNGQQITEPTLLAHGFRLGCGSNHFFRVNTSRRAAESGLEEDGQKAKEATEEPTDRNDSWEEAQREIVMKANTEWEAEKQLALQEQNRLFEAKIAALKQEGRLQEEGAKEQARLEAEREAQQAELEREMFRKEVVDVSTLIREANDLCDALGFELKFQIKMQLSLNALVTDESSAPSEDKPEDREIAVTVKDLRRGSVRHKTYEKFLLQLEFLRDSYDKLNDGEVEKGSVPMYFEPGGAELIGVSSLFLSQVQHGMMVELSPTIVGQDGKAYGQLFMELVVEPKTLAEEEYTGAAKSAITPLALGDMVRMTLTIVEARDIPQALSTFVNARYMLFDSEEVMIPEMLPGQGGGGSGTLTRRKRFNSGSASNGTNGVVVHFDKSATSSVEIPVTESFLEYIQHSKLTVQVWGHNVSMSNTDAAGSRLGSRNGTASSDSPQVSRKAAALLGIEITPELERQQAHHGFSERWRNHRHVMGVWTEIHELDDEGAYNPVGTFAEKTVSVGPVQQIRQGYARRLKIRILPSFDTDPLMITKVSSVRFGDVSVMPIADCSTECTSNLGDADLDIVRGEFSAVLTTGRASLMSGCGTRSQTKSCRKRRSPS